MCKLSEWKLHTRDTMVAWLILLLILFLTFVYFIKSLFEDSDIDYKKGRISSLYEDRMFVVLPGLDIEKSIVEFKIPHYLYSYYWEGAEVKLVEHKGQLKLIDPLTNEPLKF